MAMAALPRSPSWNPMDSAVSSERPARRCPSKRGCHHDGCDRLAALNQTMAGVVYESFTRFLHISLTQYT